MATFAEKRRERKKTEYMLTLIEGVLDANLLECRCCRYEDE